MTHIRVGLPTPDATGERAGGTHYVWRVGGWSVAVTVGSRCLDPAIRIVSGPVGIGDGIGFSPAVARRIAAALLAAADLAERRAGTTPAATPGGAQ